MHKHRDNISVGACISIYQYWRTNFSPRLKGCYSYYAIYHYLCVYVFSPFPPFELTCAGETPVCGPIPACSPDDRVTTSKTLLWHPRLASVAIPGPISRILEYCVPLYVCLILWSQARKCPHLGVYFKRKKHKSPDLHFMIHRSTGSLFQINETRRPLLHFKLAV